MKNANNQKLKRWVMETKDRIKIAREQAGLTQGELAEKIGIKQQSVFKIEAGITKNPRNIDKMAEVLGVDLNWLLTGEGLMCPNKSPQDIKIQTSLGALTSSQKDEVLAIVDKFKSLNEQMIKELGGMLKGQNNHHHAHA